jgi:hypothetical protein
MHDHEQRVRRPYSPPRLQRRTLEQAKLFLLGHAWAGDQGAKDLLEVLYPEPGAQSSEPPGKAS